jgi:hypothetical protein
MKKRSRWHFADAAVEKELRSDPLQLLADAETVKTNAVRKVFRNGGYYIKLDRRAGRSFSGEFAGAMLCAKYGIPVVEHLAWGNTSEGAILVTRAAGNFVESSLFFKERRSWKHCKALAVFLAKLLAAPLYHPDLHLGNVLIHPETAECRLVDVHGVRKKSLFDRFFRMGLMKRCIMELRNICSDSEMTELITACGISNAENFFCRSLGREHLFLEVLQPKRRRQIMEGYFKYTRWEGNGALVDVDCSAEELQNCESVICQDAKELFLFHFFLTQARIPHRRILKFEPDRETVWMEKELPEKFRSAASGKELCQRLKYNLITSSEEDFRAGYLYDIMGVFRNNQERKKGDVC